VVYTESLGGACLRGLPLAGGRADGWADRQLSRRAK
jgi:hypothetical protein